MKTHTLGAGQFIEFILSKWNETYAMIWTAEIQILKWRYDRCLNCNYHCDDHIIKIRNSPVHIICMCFIPFTFKMNSTNWFAPNAWLFLAKLVQHWGSNAEAIGLNPVEVPKFFFQVNLQLFKLQLPLRRSYLHFKVCISAVHSICIRDKSNCYQRIPEQE